MDLKPSKIVINTNSNAVIIDISGIAFTNRWLALEIQEMDNPIFLPWKTHRRNDIWAYRILLSMIAQFESDKNQVRLLNYVIKETKKIETSKQVKLYYIIAKLELKVTSKLVLLPASCVTKQDIHPS